MELNEIRGKLNKMNYEYFLELQEQLDLPLFFIGSIARSDFIQDKSDLDLEVFTDNMKSTKLKIESLFKYHQIKNENRFITFSINNIPISGYKYLFKIARTNTYFDLTIYKKSCQELLLHHRGIEINIPFIVSVFFFIIKFLHFHLNVIDKKKYSYIKKKFWSLYNKEKTASRSFNKQEYLNYYKRQHIKEYLI